jgi:hypothetical protein
MKQTRQAVHTVKQSILLRCLWLELGGKHSSLLLPQLQLQIKEKKNIL